MKITRTNYEIFTVDFLEGKLTPADAAEFLAFLDNNADIAEEIGLIRNFSATSNIAEVLPDFSYLHKNLNSVNIDTANFEEMCIAFHEGDLNAVSQKRLIDFIGNDKQLEQKFNLAKKVKINPDYSITYSGISNLKQNDARVIRLRRIALISTFAAAASLATLFMLRNSADNSGNSPIANVTSRQKVNPQTNTIISHPSANHASPISKHHYRTSLAVVDTTKDANIQFAVVDTSSSENPADIRISMIEAQPIENSIDFAEIDIKVKPYNTAIPEQMPAGLELIKETRTSLYAKASQITVDQVIRSGIRGINNMVEGDLKFQSETNNKGRITEFALSSESFNLKHKFGSN
jgi:hypothetical protein